jgi:hypothetical protein
MPPPLPSGELHPFGRGAVFAAQHYARMNQCGDNTEVKEPPYKALSHATTEGESGPTSCWSLWEGSLFIIVKQWCEFFKGPDS